MNPEIIVIGSLNHDLVLRVPLFPSVGETVFGDSLQTFSGGKGANQAYAAAKLGARVAMVGQVGNDPAGEAQISNLSSVGVDTANIMRDPRAPTGAAVIALEQNGENRIIVVPGANSSFSPEKLVPSETLLRFSHVVLLQFEIPFLTVMKAIELAKAGGSRVILDPAPAPVQGLPDELFPQVDYLTPNLSELARLSGTALNDESPSDAIVSAAHRLLARGVRKILAKSGSRGVIIISEDAVDTIDAFNVAAVDSTAAGDCFNAAFAVALVRGKSEHDAATFAAAAAACSVTRIGAQASMPTLVEVEALMRSQPRHQNAPR
jgi:ribokinase